MKFFKKNSKIGNYLCVLDWFQLFKSYFHQKCNLFLLIYYFPSTSMVIIVLPVKLNCFFFPTAAFDKGDDRRLGKKPIFSSSQVNFYNFTGPEETRYQVI